MAEAAPDLLFNQAADAHRHGDLATAEKLCREIVAANPNHLRALFALATIESDRGNYLAAEAYAARIVAIDTTNAEVHNLRGLALAALGRLPEAAESFARAAALMRDPAPALYNRGNILFDLGRLEEALDAYDAALASEPDHPVTHINRGNVLRELHRPQEALAAYDRALALDPTYADAYNNRGIALQALDRAAESLASFDRTIALNPHHADAFYNRGIALGRLRRTSEALESHKRALALDPGHADAASEACMLSAISCDWRDFARQTADLTARLRAGQRVAPLAVLSLMDDPASQARAAIAAARAFDRIAASAPKSRPRRAQLRIAYLSADFGNHVVGHTLVELFERTDRAQFELWGVSLGAAPDSAIRRRLIASFDRFVDAARWSDAAAAAFLRDNEIDVAVDVMGHTQGSRAGIFARRAAPLQVNYFGYPGTTGANFVDYIVGDRIALPETLWPHIVEKVVHLPDTYLATAAPALDPVAPSRGALGLPEAGFVFCDFNASHKITPAIFAIWMRLLTQIEGSVLWLYAGDTAQANLRREAQAHAVNPTRLIFAPPVERKAHLARLGAADLFLDTTPYNAHNTASEALAAGLPLVTVTGRSFAARVAASVLSAAGVPELATPSLEDYAQLALALARDPARLASLRSRIIAQRGTCALFDGERYRRHLATAYRMMWERHARGDAPESFVVPALS
jgi:predicted O-linked N-acetylglucosamine transferase (SPINDLY family)